MLILLRCETKWDPRSVLLKKGFALSCRMVGLGVPKGDFLTTYFSVQFNDTKTSAPSFGGLEAIKCVHQATKVGYNTQPNFNGFRVGQLQKRGGRTLLLISPKWVLVL